MQRCLMVLTLAWLGVAGSVAAQTAPPTGDQHRRYLFAPTGTEMPYRRLRAEHLGRQALAADRVVPARRGREREHAISTWRTGCSASSPSSTATSSSRRSASRRSARTAIRCGCPPCSANRRPRPRSARLSRRNAAASST